MLNAHCWSAVALGPAKPGKTSQNVENLPKPAKLLSELLSCFVSHFLQLSGPLKLLVTREHSICYTFWILLLCSLAELADFYLPVTPGASLSDSSWCWLQGLSSWDSFFCNTSDTSRGRLRQASEDLKYVILCSWCLPLARNFKIRGCLCSMLTCHPRSPIGIIWTVILRSVNSFQVLGQQFHVRYSLFLKLHLFQLNNAQGIFWVHCAQSLLGSILRWSDTLICTLTSVVQVESNHCYQISSMIEKTFFEGVRLSQLFWLCGQKQTNSYSIDCPNQSIKLSESQVVSLLIPVSFLSMEVCLRLPLGRHIFLL